MSILCRLCENPIPSLLFDGHSSLCFQLHNLLQELDVVHRQLVRYFPFSDHDFSRFSELNMMEPDGLYQWIQSVGIQKETLRREKEKENTQKQGNITAVMELIEEKNRIEYKIQHLKDSLKKLVGEKEIVSMRKMGTKVSIRDFEFIKPISKGAFGSVYLVQKVKTLDFFALKAIRKNTLEMKKNVLKMERNMLIKMSNPFVVKIYYCFQSKTHVFLAMEYLPGGDLFSLLQNVGSLSDADCRSYVADMVLAIEYVHSLDIVHRDIKPDNFLIGNTGHLKLIDFGLSTIGSQSDVMVGVKRKRRNMKISEETPTLFQTPGIKKRVRELSNLQSFITPKQARQSNVKRFSSWLKRSACQSVRLRSPISIKNQLFTPAIQPQSVAKYFPPASKTKLILPTFVTPSSNHNVKLSPSLLPLSIDLATNTKFSYVGTPHYLAPEILESKNYSFAADIWSLGVVLFEMITGSVPFDGDSKQEIFQKILHSSVDFSLLPSDCSSDAADLLKCMLAKNPRDRWTLSEIKSHPYFHSIHWESHATSSAAFKPSLERAEDTSYFDPRKKFFSLPNLDSSFLSSPPTNSSVAEKEPILDFSFASLPCLLELNMLHLN